jgi:hypothetical protein
MHPVASAALIAAFAVAAMLVFAPPPTEPSHHPPPPAPSTAASTRSTPSPTTTTTTTSAAGTSQGGAGSQSFLAELLSYLERERHVVQRLQWQPPKAAPATATSKDAAQPQQQPPAAVEWTAEQQRGHWSRFVQALTLNRAAHPLIITHTPLYASRMFPSASKLSHWTPEYVSAKLDAAAAADGSGSGLGLERVLHSVEPAREVVYVNLERIERDPAIAARMQSWGFPASYFAHIHTQKRVPRMTARDFFAPNHSTYWSQGGMCAPNLCLALLCSCAPAACFPSGRVVLVLSRSFLLFVCV